MAKKKLAVNVTVRSLIQFLEGFDDDTVVKVWSAEGSLDVPTPTLVTVKDEPSYIIIAARSDD